MSFITSLFNAPKIDRPSLDTGLTENPPRKLIIGKVANGGDFVFKGLSDYKSGDNRDMSVVMVLAGHQCNRLTQVWGDGKLIHGELLNGQRVAIDDYYDEDSSSRPRLWLTYHDGSSTQTADSFLSSTTILPVNITSAAQLRGCAYVVATMRQDDDVLQSEITFRFEYEGANLYDRRKDTTAGGSGSHRANDPPTWEYTDNAAVALDHYRLGMVGGSNNDQVVFGMGQAIWQNPYDEFEANADICDELVNGISRYAFNGRISSADDHSTTIERFAKQMAAKPYYSGGRLYVRPKQTRPVKITLYDSDLVDDAAYELSVSPGGDDLVNTVKGTFSDPETIYAEMDYPDIADTALISTDGRPFEDTLDLPDEINEERAQRIATIHLEIQKRRDQITETFMPIANVLQVGDWYERVSELRGSVTKTYEVIDITKGRGDGHRVKITGQETDSTVTAFGENQAIAIERPAPLPAITISRPPAPITTITATETTSGTAITPSGELVLIPQAGEEDNPFEGVDYFEVEYGPKGSTTALSIRDGKKLLSTYENNDGESLPLEGLMPDQEYVYRIRSIHGGLKGPFSEYDEFTTTTRLVSTEAVLLDGSSSLDIFTAIADEGEARTALEVEFDEALDEVVQEASDSRDIISVSLSTLEGTVTANPNLLYNSSFSLGDEGWALHSSVAEIVTDAYGPQLHHIDPSVSGGFRISKSEFFDIDPSADYTLSYDIYNEVDGNQAYLDIRFYNASGDIVLDGGQLTTNTEKEFGERTSRTETAPATAVSAEVRFITRTYSGGVIAVRRIKVERGATATIWSDEATTGETLNELEASVVVAQQSIADISGDLAARFAVQVKAGTSGAELELIALDGTDTGSIARLAADSIILAGTLESIHLADGTLYNLLTASGGPVDVPPGTGVAQGAETLLMTSAITTVGRQVRLDISAAFTIEWDAVPNNKFGAVSQNVFRNSIVIKMDGNEILDRTLNDCTNWGNLGTSTPAETGGASLIFSHNPPAGVHIYTIYIKTAHLVGHDDTYKGNLVCDASELLMLEVDN